MRELRGKVAVVTGAASGIGRAMALRFAREGMRVVLADVEEEPLADAYKGAIQLGADSIAVATDVSNWWQVDALARRAFDAYGGVNARLPQQQRWGRRWRNDVGALADGLGVGARCQPLGCHPWSAGVRPANDCPRGRARRCQHRVTSPAFGVPAERLQHYGATKYMPSSPSAKVSIRSGDGDLCGKVRVSVLCPAWVKDEDRRRRSEIGRPVSRGRRAGEGITARPWSIEQMIRFGSGERHRAGRSGRERDSMRSCKIVFGFSRTRIRRVLSEVRATRLASSKGEIPEFDTFKDVILARPT